MNRFISFRSLGGKITFITVLVTFIALSITIATMLAFSFKKEKEDLIGNSNSLALLIGQNSTAVILYRDHDTANEILSTLEPINSIIGGRLLDASDKILAEYYSNLENNTLLVRQLKQQTENNHLSVSTDFLSLYRNTIFTVINPIYLNDKKIGSIQLYIGLSAFKKQIVYDSAIGITVLFLATILAFFVTIKLKRSILDPINDLNKTTHQIVTSADFSLRVQKTTDDEIGVFTDSFNKMLNEIEIRDAGLEQAVDQLTTAKSVAEKASQAKSAFLSRMSHELRTPMNAILGFSQLLDTDDLTEDQHESVTEILNAGYHLLELINQVLELSKIESGKLGLDIRPIPINKVLHHCLPMIQTQAEKRQIALHNQVTAIECQVHADFTALKQILINLLSNAVKYNNEKGTIALSCQRSGNGFLRINIVDTGQGIAPENLSKIFVPFDRLGKENEGIEGTGIGLAISKKLIQEMNGNIGVESKINHGSCFWIELPLVDSSVPEKTLSASEIESVSGFIDQA